MPAQVKRQPTMSSRALVLDPAARIRHLSEHGSSVGVDRAIPIKRYFRSGSEMERQARVYYTEGQWDRAFILYNRFATLFIEKLPKHPEYSKAPATDKTRIKKLLKQAMPRAMELKEKLKEKYEKEKEDLEQVIQQEEADRLKKSEEKQRLEELEEAEKKSNQADEIVAFFSGQGGEVTSAVSKDVGGQSLEVNEGETESKPSQDIREDSVVRREGQSGTNEPLSYQAQTAEVESLPDNSELTATDPMLANVFPPGPVTTASSEPVPSAPPLSVTPLSVTPQLPPSYDQIIGQAPIGSVTGAQMTPPPALQSPAVHPVLQQPTYQGSLFQSPFASTAQGQPHPFTTPPSTPYSPYQYNQQYGQQPGWWGSAHPSYTATSSTQQDVEEIGSTKPVPPVVDRSSKPDSLKALSTSTSWGAFDGYRPVYIPSDTATRFEEVASTNTRKNVETCGILAGKLSKNTLNITHIVVPKQKGNADSCETTNEEELFDVQDQYDLITIGWIHTHPSQTAFMSSIDLHCHCSYQIMMDEAVAIVVAPRHNQVGYYMLTEPHGLNYITHCEEEGFHVHPKEPPLYEECKHIHHDRNKYIQIVDLR